MKKNSMFCPVCVMRLRALEKEFYIETFQICHWIFKGLN